MQLQSRGPLSSQLAGDDAARPRHTTSTTEDASPEPARRLQPLLLWASVPGLAVAAYLSVLWIGFLSDDFVLLNLAKVRGLDLGALSPASEWPFYRPFGVITTWELGWQFWGFNPFPYHLLSLVLHAGTSLLFGLWLADITSNRMLGWLAGALFAVYPVNVEAVGWVASQWDLWAAFFCLASLWLFTKWWRSTGSWYLYVLSLASFFLGVFSKESIFTFLPIFPLSIWLLYRPLRRGWGRTLLISIVPFVAVLLFNIGIRVVTNAPLGYSAARTDYWDFFWDSMVSFLGMLIAPVNALFEGELLQQIVAALVSVGLLVGLVAYGRREWRLLLLGGLWIVFAVGPALNLSANLLGLPPGSDYLPNNRYLYLATAGYAIIISALLAPLVSSLYSQHRVVAGAVVIIPLLAGIALAWANLQPWHVATAQAESINSDLLRLIPPEKRPQGMVWYIQNLPDNYAGAYIFRLGLGNMRNLTSPTGDTPDPKALGPDVTDMASVNLNPDGRDAFAIRFVPDQEGDSYDINYVAGRTSAETAPTPTDGSMDLHVWDFTSCSEGASTAWRPSHAATTCEEGSGLAVTPQSADPQLLGPPISFGSDVGDARFLRLRVSVKYSPDMPSDYFLSQWYWGDPASGFDETHQITSAINHSGTTQVYWSFIPVADLPSNELILRFDPINAQISEQIEWIAADLVK